MGTSKIHDHAKSLKANQDAKKALEIELLREAQRQTASLPKTATFGGRRAVRDDGNLLWEPAPPVSPDLSIDHAGASRQAFEEADWQPTLDHMRHYAEVLLPRLRDILDAHRAEPYTIPVFPDGPREAVRDAILAALQPFEDRYGEIVREIRVHAERGRTLKYHELATLAKPRPALDLDAATQAWTKPMARLRTLPDLPTDRAIDMTPAELTQVAARLREWDTTLQECRHAPVQVIRQLGGLRQGIDVTLDTIARNTAARVYSWWTLAVPLHPMDVYPLIGIGVN